MNRNSASAKKNVEPIVLCLFIVCVKPWNQNIVGVLTQRSLKSETDQNTYCSVIMAWSMFVWVGSCVWLSQTGSRISFHGQSIYLLTDCFHWGRYVSVFLVTSCWQGVLAVFSSNFWPPESFFFFWGFVYHLVEDLFNRWNLLSHSLLFDIFVQSEQRIILATMRVYEHLSLSARGEKCKAVRDVSLAVPRLVAPPGAFLTFIDHR